MKSSMCALKGVIVRLVEPSTQKFPSNEKKIMVPSPKVLANF
jgi:hypothetical protein